MHTADTVHTVEAKITTFAISTIFASFAKETVNKKSLYKFIKLQ